MQVMCGYSLGDVGDRGFIYVLKYFLSVCILDTGDITGMRQTKMPALLEFAV